MKLSDYVVEFLKKTGVNTVFGYQGGAITHFVDSIYKADGIKFVSSYHEQASAFSAEAYSRVNGNIGVATATSGPGATNLVTGIGSAYFDSIPCLYITGQVNSYEYKSSPQIRQVGFQETDIVSIVKSITKYSVMVTEPDKIRYYLEKAVYLAKNGRKGPVLIDLPMNIQRAEIDPDKLISFYNSSEYKNKDGSINNQIISEVINLIKDSSRPVILAGGGVRLSGASEKLCEFAKLTDIPVVTTLMGLDCINCDSDSYVGFMGTYGNRYSNLAVANSDLLIVLGSRLTTRQTSPIVDSFARNAKIIRIDIDKNELNLKLKEDISVEADINDFLNKLINKLKNSKNNFNFKLWKDKINSFIKQYPSYPTQKVSGKLDPNEFMYNLSNQFNSDSIICLDVGQNQIWAAQSLKLKGKQRILTSGGMGAMGFALPSAIGAYMASPNSKIVVIAGDGGIQMNIQELQTIVRENIPIKIFILNNNALGMIRHFQEMYFDSRYFGTIQGYSAPDFTKIGYAYNIETININDKYNFDLIKEKLNDNKSYIFNVELSNKTYIIPKLGMGRPIEDQDPLVDREELRNNMIIDVYKK